MDMIRWYFEPFSVSTIALFCVALAGCAFLGVSVLCQSAWRDGRVYWIRAAQTVRQVW